jgi:hypothetical protein
MLSRRATFFFVLVAICLALVPVTPSEFRLVPLIAAGVAAFWGTVVAIEDLLNRRRAPRAPRAMSSPPFAPPPPPGSGPDRD